LYSLDFVFIELVSGQIYLNVFYIFYRKLYSIVPCTVLDKHVYK
jgi:hypothetical protein